MPNNSLIVAAVLLSLISSGALAQEQQQQPQKAQEHQEEQQACENDAYALCGEAIPDEDRIAACLKKNWSKVSKECRTVMQNHGKKHRGARKGGKTGDN